MSVTHLAHSFGPKPIQQKSNIPDLVVILNPSENLGLIRECTTMKVPTIGIVDTDTDPRIVTYAIPANMEVSTRPLCLVIQSAYKPFLLIVDTYGGTCGIDAQSRWIGREGGTAEGRRWTWDTSAMSVAAVLYDRSYATKAIAHTVTTSSHGNPSSSVGKFPSSRTKSLESAETGNLSPWTYVPVTSSNTRREKWRQVKPLDHVKCSNGHET